VLSEGGANLGLTVVTICFRNNSTIMSERNVEYHTDFKRRLEDTESTKGP
jgi:hypothetical protein